MMQRFGQRSGPRPGGTKSDHSHRPPSTSRVAALPTKSATSGARKQSRKNAVITRSNSPVRGITRRASPHTNRTREFPPTRRRASSTIRGLESITVMAAVLFTSSSRSSSLPSPSPSISALRAFAASPMNAVRQRCRAWPKVDHSSHRYQLAIESKFITAGTARPPSDSAGQYPQQGVFPKACFPRTAGSGRARRSRTGHPHGIRRRMRARHSHRWPSDVAFQPSA